MRYVKFLRTYFGHCIEILCFIRETTLTVQSLSVVHKHTDMKKKKNNLKITTTEINMNGYVMNPNEIKQIETNVFVTA